MDKYRQVVFDTVQQTYPTDVNITCQFETCKDLKVSTWDWVGLFKVAWTSTNQYVSYQYVQLPEGYCENEKNRFKMVWQAKHLPNEDGEFYQFCYISYHQSMCGASTPFQFCRPRAVDFVEEDAEDGVMIRSRADVLQEEIRKLQHDLMIRTKERDDLEEQLASTRKSLESRNQLVEGLQIELTDCVERTRAEVRKREDMSIQIASLQKKLDDATVEKQHLSKQLVTRAQELEDLDHTIQELLRSVKVLEAQKDELSGEKQSLVDELNTYKMQVTESQSQASQHVKTIDVLTTEMKVQSVASAGMREEIQVLLQEKEKAEKNLLLKEREIVGLMNQIRDTQTRHLDLANELVNANDKLLACDAVKQKLCGDLEAYEQTQQEMNTKLENQESELRTLKHKNEHKKKELLKIKKDLAVKVQELEQTSQLLTATEDSLKQALENVNNTTTSVKENAEKGQEQAKQISLIKVKLFETCKERDALKMQFHQFVSDLKKVLHCEDAAPDRKETSSKQYLELDKESDCIIEHINMLEGRRESLVTELLAKERSLQEKDEQLAHAEEKILELQHENSVKTQELQKQEESLVGGSQEQGKADGDLKMVQEKSEMEDAEAARFALWTANEDLKSRLEQKEAELADIQVMVEDLEYNLERADLERQSLKETVEVLQMKLELGKMEYTKKARESHDLGKKVKKQTKLLQQLEMAQQEDDPMKVKALLDLKKQMEQIISEKDSMLKELEQQMQQLSAQKETKDEGSCTDSDVSIDGDGNETVDEFRLIHGNPYAQKGPFGEGIIRSTLEEEKEAYGTGPMLSAAAEDCTAFPPLEPEVLSGQEAACLEVGEAQAEDATPEVFEDCKANLVPEESFMDAIGEGMKICPICGASIYTNGELEEHFARHFGRMCPVCLKQADDSMSPEGFEKHVNSCLDGNSGSGAAQDTSFD